MKQKPTLYVLTHCESCYNRQHIFTGRLNSHLTDEGIRHAKRMAEQLREVKLDVAIHTSLDRTQETLKYILTYHPGCRTEVDDRIIERDYGKLSGKSKDKYARENPEKYPIYHRSYEVAPPGGESMKAVEERVMPFLRELVERMKRERVNVLIVAHGNSIRPIIRHFEKLSAEEMMDLEYLRHRIFTYEIE
jgi:2,3-bisphosphoglycerate-dependent phosphoglycerate mutase